MIALYQNGERLMPANGVRPSGPFPRLLGSNSARGCEPATQPWQACGYSPDDCRAPHVLQEAGGGALVSITLCGSRMPSTSW